MEEKNKIFTMISFDNGWMISKIQLYVLVTNEINEKYG